MFSLGRILITEGARKVLQEAGVSAETLLRRHQRGDWGEVSRGAAQDNNRAIDGGGDLLSHYFVGEGKLVLVLTNDRRNCTRICAYEDMY